MCALSRIEEVFKTSIIYIYIYTVIMVQKEKGVSAPLYN